MDKATLDQKHPTYDAQRWEALEALSEGGKKFHKLIETFLPQNPMEPELMYAQRKKRAKFHSYTGAIINLYVAWLFAANFSVKAYKKDSEEPQNPDKFYGVFQENVGGERTLTTFMKGRAREAMRKGKSSWLIQLPSDEGRPPADRDEYDKRGLGRATLTEIDPKELLDWEYDDEGNYLWAIVKTISNERKSPFASRNAEKQTWKVYDREMVTTFELVKRQESDGTVKEEEVRQVGEPAKHGFKRVPIITLCLEEEMCIGEQTYDAQIAHFQADAGLDWAIMRTCYAMPVFKLEDEDNKPTMGVGYGLYLGVNEEMEWSSPPADSFDTISKNRDAKRDEIFRIVHQMAQGIDNNAETVGRSAESKEIDAAATRLMLNTYGGVVAAAIEETYETISEARDEKDLEWSVEGFSGYDVATAGTLLANIKMAKDVGIPSKTFQKEISTKAALSLVPEADQKVKDKIRSEIGSYDFEVTGKTVEQQLADKTIEAQKSMTDAKLASQESMTEATLKSQEKVAKQAKANASAKPVKK
jgi:hypothetical protein